ncbi:MAG: DUF58 domain-containing protein [Acidimicrobiia bacterium]|nr:DUF58 domain-containing protein [Acidimicrobiia bacterium]
MLTRPGWLVLAGAVGSFFVGRLFGLVELYLLGASLVVLVALGVARVLLTRLRLEVGRQVTPRRVHAGQPARVELTVTNRSDRPTPVLRLHDPVTGTQGATVLLAPVAEGLIVRSAYRLPTERRGIVGIGPLGVVLTDPFGLATVRAQAAPRSELTVLPRIHDVIPPPVAGGDEPLAGLRQVALATSAGDDFSALREYVVGDDLRRVHWPSSARHGDLLIRQDEIHWQGRTTVVLDTRVHTHRGESFEIAVSAAASLVSAAWKRRDLLRLVTTAGFDSGVVGGAAHVEQLLEVLATVAPAQPGSLRGLMESVHRGGSASVVVLVGSVGARELLSVLSLGAAVGSAVVVATAPGAGQRPGTTGVDTRANHPDILLLDDRPFAPTWNTAMLTKRARRSRPRGIGR